MTHSAQRPGPPRPFQPAGVPHSEQYLSMGERCEDHRVANEIAKRNEELQQLHAEYRHLPPLPPQLSGPLYATQDVPGYDETAASQAFYKACADGDLDHVRKFIAESSPTEADLSYALEEACQNLHVEVVRYILLQPEAPQIHYRCFRRCIAFPEDEFILEVDYVRSRTESQSIFTSGSPKLLDLLKTLISCGGWHPNQLLGPIQRGKRSPLVPPCQEVALHYPRCILEMEILRFLLDAGADPTIGRGLAEGSSWFELTQRPVQRLKGHVLEMAVNMGTPEAVALLIEHGAKPEYGIALHSLVRRRPDPAYGKVMDEELVGELCRKTPFLEYPTLSTRFAMAQQLIAAGADIKKVDNIYRLPEVGRWVRWCTREYRASALTHATNCLDWAFVRWLLENGAGPDFLYFEDLIYGIGAGDEDRMKYDELLRTFKQQRAQKESVAPKMGLSVA